MRAMIGTWRMSLEGIELGMEAMEKGAGASGALLKAIELIEDNPYYKSVGYGGLPNRHGKVQLDAGFMDGDDGAFGAIGALEEYPHPFALAVKLASLPTNNFRVGRGAANFAREQGQIKQNMLSDRAAIHYHNRIIQDKSDKHQLSPYNGHDTVGIVALDDQAKISVGTSTSGLFMKEDGRLGDSPIIGSGFYADSKVGGATATGLGEDLMRGLVSFRIVQLMAQGDSPQNACDKVLRSVFQDLVAKRGQAGDLSVVALSHDGTWGAATTIDNFSIVYASERQAAATYLVSPIQQGETKISLASQAWLDEYIKTRTGPLEKLGSDGEASSMDNEVKDPWWPLVETLVTDPREKELLMIAKSKLGDILKSLSQQVAIPSYQTSSQEAAPFGPGPKAALEHILGLGQALGFEGEMVDNQVVYLTFGPQESHIAIIGHLDVVPANEAGWLTDPFSLVLKEDRLFGRGVLDNKGPIITCLFAMAAIKIYCQKHQLKLKRGLRIIFGSNEETGMKDMETYLRHQPAPLFGFTPDCKFPVVVGEKGRLRCRITSTWSGASDFVKFINQYWIAANNSGDRLGIQTYDETYGPLEMRQYHLDCNEDVLNFDFSIAYPPLDKDQMVLGIKQVAETSGFELHILQDRPQVAYDRTHPDLDVLAQVYQLFTQSDQAFVTTSGGTYASVMPNVYPFGPSFPHQKGIAHQANEYWDVDDLIANLYIYSLALWRLAGLEEKGESDD